MDKRTKDKRTNEQVIYTDGKRITVTDSTLRVRWHNYKLDGIIRHGFYVMRPSRLPAILLVLTGLLVILVGFAGLIPANKFNAVSIGGFVFDSNSMTMALGAILSLIGVIALGVMRDRYAVRIATAEGEKNVIVSQRREYIAQIVDALSVSHYGARHAGRVLQPRS